MIIAFLFLSLILRLCLRLVCPLVDFLPVTKAASEQLRETMQYARQRIMTLHTAQWNMLRIQTDKKTKTRTKTKTNPSNKGTDTNKGDLDFLLET